MIKSTMLIMFFVTLVLTGISSPVSIFYIFLFFYIINSRLFSAVPWCCMDKSQVQSRNHICEESCYAHLEEERTWNCDVSHKNINNSNVQRIEVLRLKQSLHARIAHVQWTGNARSSRFKSSYLYHPLSCLHWRLCLTFTRHGTTFLIISFRRVHRRK
jgi:hypothetical protein